LVKITNDVSLLPLKLLADVTENQEPTRHLLSLEHTNYIVRESNEISVLNTADAPMDLRLEY
jgi:hypothetical protein